MRIKERCSFRTKARWIGAILLIGTAHDGTVSKADGSTYRETRIGAVRMRHIRFGGFYQFANFGWQFLFFINRNLSLKGERFQLATCFRWGISPRINDEKVLSAIFVHASSACICLRRQIGLHPFGTKNRSAKILKIFEYT